MVIVMRVIFFQGSGCYDRLAVDILLQQNLNAFQQDLEGRVHSSSGKLFVPEVLQNYTQLIPMVDTFS